MQRPGFWDDSEAAARVSAQHAATQRRLETFRSLESDVVRPRRARGAVRRRSRAGLGARVAARLDRGPPGAARGGEALQRGVRRGRRGRHGALGRGRHRLAGLGRDAPAHVPALGRAARLPGGDEGGVTGRGGRAQVGDLHRPWRERLRPVRGRAGRPPAGPDLALRRAEAPPHRVRPGRRRAAGRRRRRGRPRRGGPAGRHLPRLRAPAASTSTRPTRRSASPTSRPGSSSSARTSARRRRTRPRR